MSVLTNTPAMAAAHHILPLHVAASETPVCVMYGAEVYITMLVCRGMFNEAVQQGICRSSRQVATGKSRTSLSHLCVATTH